MTTGTLADGLAGVVALMVGVVALLVQVYSVAYLRDDTRYPPYAAQVSPLHRRDAAGRASPPT